jgi:flagellum-specific ATP synthase
MNAVPQLLNQNVTAFLRDCGQLAAIADPIQVSGKVTRVAGLILECTGLKLAVGNNCLVGVNDGSYVDAEVVGFANDRLFLMPNGHMHGIEPGAQVLPEDITLCLPKPGMVNHPRQRTSDRAKHFPVGATLLGRVVDGAGRPLDEHGPLNASQMKPLYGRPSNPLTRAPINTILDTGIRAINALLTVGRGQRIGLFAGSGVGKSVLLGMMARYTSADVIVVGLIGERGREVKEFIEHILGTEGMARSDFRARLMQRLLLNTSGTKARTSCSSWTRLPVMPWPSAKSHWQSANPPLQRVIRLRCLPSCPS